MFQFSDQHIEDFQTLGYTVFRGIVPPKLIDELRKQCALGAIAARERGGANTQRFQPVSAFPVDLRPFEEFQNLPDIREAVSRIVGGEFEFSGVDTLGVLLEPAEKPWCMHWHRDWRDNVPGVDLDAWEEKSQDVNLFNQVNCALYEDSSTWVVPGSHLRPDTEAEIARFPTRPILEPDVEGLSNAERERVCLDYCESLPNAQRLLLDAGDYCLYRNTLWHLGNYVTYRKRATLHDAIMTPAFREWFDTAPAIAKQRVEQGIVWQNPNSQRIAA